MLKMMMAMMMMKMIMDDEDDYEDDDGDDDDVFSHFGRAHFPETLPIVTRQAHCNKRLDVRKLLRTK